MDEDVPACVIQIGKKCLGHKAIFVIVHNTKKKHNTIIRLVGKDDMQICMNKILGCIT